MKRSGSSEVVQSAAKRSSGESGALAGFRVPKLPPSTENDLGSRKVMKSVVPWVVDQLNYKLLDLVGLQKDVPFVKPLIIQEVVKEQGLTS